MPEKNELPEGWILSSLGEICQINDRDHKTPNYQESGYPLISPKTFTKSGIDFSKTKYVGDDELNAFERKCNPEKKDILYSRIGTIGESRLLEFDQKFVALHSIALIKPFQKIKNTNFIFFFLKSQFAQDQAFKGVKSIGVPDLGLKKIKSMQILLPPLSEQHRIVSAIEAIFSRLDAAEARLERVPEIMKQFRQSVLAAACDWRLT
ncbi:restriction endonuclease subunit S [Methanolacinia petrolearia]|uniref:restriction endonuclease subunit S n=1 Tax=Methanolacinia petrolearia TaxID=54120 RepID=UPI003BAB63F1